MNDRDIIKSASSSNNNEELSKHKINKKASIFNADKSSDTKNYVKSCFSDEDDDSEEDSNEDIMNLAEKVDKLKTSRQSLVQRMSTMNLKVPDKAGSNKEAQGKNELCPERTNEASAPSNYFDHENEENPEKGMSKNRFREVESPKGDEDSSDFEEDLDEHIKAEFPVGGSKKDLSIQEPQKEQKKEKKEKKEEKIVKPMGVPSIQIIPEQRIRKSVHTLGVRSNPIGQLPILEGYLQKKSTNFLKSWQKRYYVLKNRKLYYYKNEEKEIKVGVIDFDLLTVKLEAVKTSQFIKITPIGGTRVFLLKASDEDEGKMWLQTLEKHIEISRGYFLTLSKVVKMKKYWKYDRISEMKFLEQADTGDLILFRTKNVGAKLQRSVTMSEYDHVGLILRYNNGELVLFEATGKEGVGVCRWKTFTESNWHTLYSKLVYRKLAIKRTEEMITGMEKFVRYSVGKKYQLNASKLLKKRSANFEDYLKKENRTFFCSELVAACYKRMGLLSKDVSAASYLPGAFTAKKKLQLLNGARLDDEYLLDFDI